MAGLLNPWGGDGRTMSSYTPTLRERATDYVRGLLFSDDREGQQRAERVMNVAEIPFGFATDAYDATRAGAEGRYGEAAMLGAMALIPGKAPRELTHIAGNTARRTIRAFHGSPHDFDRFSLDKIGTGEGAQAYGHGLYFAENEGVAKGYRDALSRPLNTGDLGRDLANYAVTQKRGSVDDAIAYLNREMANYDNRPAGWPSPEYKKQYEDALGILTSGNWKPAGRMYEVEIDADPEQFLDWDKPLSEQPEAVRKGFGSLVDRDLSKETGWAKMSGQQALDAIMERYGSLDWPDNADATLRQQYRTNARSKASALLADKGIPGIKYLDAGSRSKGVAQVQPMYKGKPYGDPIPATAWNQIDQLTQRYKDMGYDVEVQDLGTRNYVVFDDNLINIIRKYGIAGLLGGGAAMNAMTAEPQEQY